MAKEKFIPPAAIETERLIIRPFLSKEEHKRAEASGRVGAFPDSKYDELESLGYYGPALQIPLRPYAITLKSGELIGCIGLGYDNHDNSSVWGKQIFKEFQSGSYGSEAFKALVDYIVTPCLSMSFNYISFEEGDRGNVEIKVSEAPLEKACSEVEGLSNYPSLSANLKAGATVSGLELHINWVDSSVIKCSFPADESKRELTEMVKRLSFLEFKIRLAEGRSKYEVREGEETPSDEVIGGWKAEKLSLLHHIKTSCADDPSTKKVVEYLIDEPADDLTPLHYAAKYGRVEAVKALLEAGASIEAEDGKGMTPLHYAVLHSGVETVKALLEAGANKDAQNKVATPLRLAVGIGAVEIAKALLEAGASIEAEYKGLEESCNVALKQILADARYADKIASKVEGIGEINPEADYSLIINRASKLLLAKLTKPVELMEYLDRLAINDDLKAPLISKYKGDHADFFAAATDAEPYMLYGFLGEAAAQHEL